MWGFYLIHDMRYVSSLDALAPAGILLEVETRAENCSGTLEFLDKFPQYFAQCQLQMPCCTAEFCTSPRNLTCNFFIMKKTIH